MEPANNPSECDMPLLPKEVLRARELVASGNDTPEDQRAADAGQLLRIGRGLYSLPESPITEHHDLAQVAARVPHGVVCLTSALQIPPAHHASPGAFI